MARYVFALAREAFEGQLSLRAMSLVYTTMLAIVPLLAFSFSILKGLGFHRQMQPLLAQFLAPLGDKGEEVTSSIIVFVDNVQGTTLAGVSLGFLLFTVLSMAQKVED
ncbi:MAG: YihY/virulence factor BrkB family protein, partial [Gammaproteobacteria bacterium]|nr:YihY/virulence factor BrkB family protein [Gammaproteobacteria bacterium]